MSFDLKPEIPISIMTKSVDEIIWTVNRSPVPILLAGRINESTWSRTFDMIRGHYDDQISSNKSLKWALIPCAVPCVMAKMISMNKERQDAWLEILRSQKQIYQKFGVQVTLAKEISYNDSGSGSSSSSMFTVGLTFTVAGPMPTPMPTGYSTIMAEAVPIGITAETSSYSKYNNNNNNNNKYEDNNNNNNNSQSSIEERLGKLRSIKHMLTDQEYEEKRKEILSQI
jgi:hypothetical protein